ncbi:hypothetical protein [Actinokineospora sp.]|uniref:hypothetical protein n=1 Tax=Actinokineospora sp. TaxID=1872133 RepID=UPI003D6AA38D
MARWTITDDDGRVMTIELLRDCLIITVDLSGPFQTRHAEIVQDVRQKLGVAIGQLSRTHD